MLIVDIRVMHKQQNWYLYNIHDRFQYHQKCRYWPDTNTDTRIGAALYFKGDPSDPPDPPLLYNTFCTSIVSSYIH